MMLKDNYTDIVRNIPEYVTLVAVSKTQTVEAIQQLYNMGHRDFGENRIQEMVDKYQKLPKDIRWHMIGHVQSNKIKYMADFVHLIHGIDKAKRLSEVQKQAAAAGRTIDVLLQIHIAEEDTKFGMDAAEVFHTLEKINKNPLPNVNIKGLMGMATFTDDKEQIKKEFSHLSELYKDLQKEFPQIQILSMGMSGDYKTAIEEGSNLIRVGSAIFGHRQTD